MREVQREAHNIEGDMESRFKSMLMQNEAKKRHLPASLTSELEDHYRQGEQDLSEEINSIQSGFSQTRELVLQRLGGPFEYS